VLDKNLEEEKATSRKLTLIADAPGRGATGDCGFCPKAGAATAKANKLAPII
jgi:hypothetical protein